MTYCVSSGIVEISSRFKLPSVLDLEAHNTVSAFKREGKEASYGQEGLGVEIGRRNAYC